MDCTKVVPTLVLILSGRTYNAIYQNSDKAHVFCGALPFQQAPTDVCTLNRSRVTFGFVKTVACTPPKKGKKQMNKNTNLFTRIILTFWSRIQGSLWEICQTVPEKIRKKSCQVGYHSWNWRGYWFLKYPNLQKFVNFKKIYMPIWGY